MPIAAGGAYLFAPATAYRVRPGRTKREHPLPLDEPQVDNAPVGLIHRLLSSRGAAHAGRDRDARSDGNVVRQWSSAHPPKPVDPNSVRIHDALVSDAIRFPSQRPARIASSGISTKKRSRRSARPSRDVHRQTERQRSDVTRARRACCAIRALPQATPTLRAQYELAKRVDALHSQVEGRAREGSSRHVSTLSGPTQLKTVRAEVIGEEPPDQSRRLGWLLFERFYKLSYLEGAARQSRRHNRKRRRRTDSRYAYRLR